MNLGQKMKMGGSSWNKDDDIAFERALAIYTNEDNRWEKIAAAVPGKTVEQIKEHYNILVHDVMLIESGRVPLPDYVSPDESNGTASDRGKSICERGDNSEREDHQHESKSVPKTKRRKGIPWTESEHKKFLLGLEKYGKGDWRSISRNYVVSRTPTQVASHAQKYFARLKAKDVNKTMSIRPSIHDVTVGENRDTSTRQSPFTWQSTQPTPHQSLVRPMPGTLSIWRPPATSSTWRPPATSSTWRPPATSSIWNTQAPTSQQLIVRPVYVTSSMWNTQANQATSQPSPNLPMHDTSNIWNTQGTRVISQPSSLDLPTYGTSNMWNTQAALQQSVNNPNYGTPITDQSMVGPMLSPFGSHMNRMAPPRMPYGAQDQIVPNYSSVPSTSSNNGSMPHNMTHYMP